jgi:hypothetical protein
MPRPARPTHPCVSGSPSLGSCAPVPPASRPVTGPDDALRVVMAAIHQPPSDETVVLLLDAAHRGGICLVCSGASTATQVSALVPVLTTATGTDTPIGAVVMATVRPGLGITPGPDDEATFIAMRHGLALAGIDLIDWFLIDDDLVASVAELAGTCWLWQAEEPPW